MLDFIQYHQHVSDTNAITYSQVIFRIAILIVLVYRLETIILVAPFIDRMSSEYFQSQTEISLDI